MAYQVPTTAVVDFDLMLGYQIVADPLAVDFNLTDQEASIYPIPPQFMVSAGHGIDLASIEAASQTAQVYSMTPAQKAIRRVLSLADASVVTDDRQAQGWGRVSEKDNQGDGVPQPWRSAAIVDPGRVAGGWDQVPPKDERQAGEHQAWNRAGIPGDDATDQAYIAAPPKDVRDRYPFIDSAKYWQPMELSAGQLYVAGADFDLSESIYSAPGATAVDFLFVPPIMQVETIPTRPIDSGRDAQNWTTNAPADIRYKHPWDDKPRIGTEVDFDYDQQPTPPIEEPPEQPEVKRTYFVMNASSLVVMPAGTPLEFSELKIDIDADSWAWVMTCTIMNRASMDLIRPTSAGPAEVVATVNGHQWRFIVESYGLQKKFPTERYQIKGVSRTQLLASPYAPQRTGRIDVPTGVLQLMNDQLDLTGFSVDYQVGLPDYTIPAGAWGYEDKTPLQVISEVAQSVGAIVYPDPVDDLVYIRHRYRQAGPWYFDGLAAGEIDAIILDAQIISYSSQWEPKPAYNYVLVSGITDGVATTVIRDGTAGDVAAPDDFHDLNLDSGQGRLKGLSVLASGGNQEVVNVETVLPPGGTPKLVTPATLVEILDSQDPANTWRGNALATSIYVSQPGASRVTQTVKIERHHY